MHSGVVHPGPYYDLEYPPSAIPLQLEPNPPPTSTSSCTQPTSLGATSPSLAGSMGQATSSTAASITALQSQLEAAAYGETEDDADNGAGAGAGARTSLERWTTAREGSTRHRRRSSLPVAPDVAPAGLAPSSATPCRARSSSTTPVSRSFSLYERSPPDWSDTGTLYFQPGKSPVVFPTRARPISVLATIPSSPIPPLSATSSASSVQPLLSPSIALTPPSATLPSSKPWPIPTLFYARPDISSSAPDLATAEAEPPPGLPTDEQRPTTLYETNQVSFSTGESEEKRYHALLELVETEQGYLSGLRILVKGYFTTLPFLDVLTAADVAAVVRNAEDLLALHERISQRLVQVEQELEWMGTGREAGADGDRDAKVRGAASRVARVFIEELDNFALYDDFCAKHGEAIDIIRAVEARPEWEAYERQCAVALQVPSESGESTPLASSLSQSSFFPIVPLTATTSQPHEPTPARQPKLRFNDYAIKPVQRICRYPLVFGAVLKHLGDCPEGAEVKRAWDGMRKAVEGVDEARRIHEGELRTKIVASRMEFQSPIGWAFCDVLGPTILIGTLHVLHRSPTDPFRNKYYGCFLYRTHLVMLKIRKRDSYEPREWLPLRHFDIQSIEEGEGFLPQSIRLSFDHHHFELGATCAPEKALWLASLTSAQVEARRQWDEQPLDEDGHPTLFDDTLVSSVSPAGKTTPATLTSSSRSPHVRSSSASLRTTGPTLPTPADQRRHSYFDEPIPAQTSPTVPNVPLPTPTGRSHFSTTASTLLGRTPSAQRQTIDLRLADVFSEECLAARAQAARESSVAALPPRRRAMSSGPKATPGSAPQSLGRLSMKERRRMSCVDIRATTISGGEFRGAVGFDVELSQVYRDEVADKKWSAALKRVKVNGGRPRPALPNIDTSLAEKNASVGGTWKSRAAALRRVASQSSIADPRGRSPTAAAFNLSANASSDVERINSVSSTGSSSGTSNSQLVFDSPMSSVPPSPDLSRLDSDHLPHKSPPMAPLPPRSLSEGVTSAFRLKRRGSQLALLHPDTLLTASPDHSPPSPSEASFSPTSDITHLQRRPSTLSTFFSKRVQSSPALTSIFGGHPERSLSSKSTSHLPLSGPAASLSSGSSPHLVLAADPSGSPSPESMSECGSPVSTAPPSPSMGSQVSLESTSTPTLVNADVGPVATLRKKSMRFKFKLSHRLSPMN